MSPARILSRIHTVHDEVKDKNFVLEMSWVTEGQF